MFSATLATKDGVMETGVGSSESERSGEPGTGDASTSRVSREARYRRFVNEGAGAHIFNCDSEGKLDGKEESHEEVGKRPGIYHSHQSTGPLAANPPG